MKKLLLILTLILTFGLCSACGETDIPAESTIVTPATEIETTIDEISLAFASGDITALELYNVVDIGDYNIAADQIRTLLSSIFVIIAPYVEIEVTDSAIETSLDGVQTGTAEIILTYPDIVSIVSDIIDEANATVTLSQLIAGDFDVLIDTIKTGLNLTLSGDYPTITETKALEFTSVSVSGTEIWTLDKGSLATLISDMTSDLIKLLPIEI